MKKVTVIIDGDGFLHPDHNDSLKKIDIIPQPVAHHHYSIYMGLFIKFTLIIISKSIPSA